MNGCQAGEVRDMPLQEGESVGVVGVNATPGNPVNKVHDHATNALLCAAPAEINSKLIALALLRGTRFAKEPEGWGR
jgi:hypothetical protein